MSESITFPGQLEVIKQYAIGKKQLVEVGVCFGGTSKYLRSWMAPDGTLSLVDPFPADLDQTWNGKKLTPSLEQAQKAINSVDRGTVEWYISESAEASRVYPHSADFVFIDGLHDESSVKLDWASWAPKVAPGGVVLFHDVAPYCPGVVKAWNNIKLTPGWECLGVKLSIGIMRKL